MERVRAGYGFTSCAARLLQLLFLTGCLTACGRMDYSTRWDEANDRAQRGAPLAQLHFDRGALRDPYSVDLSRDYKRHGYGINAPLYSDDHHKLHWATSRTKDYKWFSGLQMSFDF